MKQKTHKGAAKRFKTTGSGKLRAGKANVRHLLQNKSKGQKAEGKNGIEVHASRTKAVKKLLSI